MSSTSDAYGLHHQMMEFSAKLTETNDAVQIHVDGFRVLSGIQDETTLVPLRILLAELSKQLLAQSCKIDTSV